MASPPVAVECCGVLAESLLRVRGPLGVRGAVCNRPGVRGPHGAYCVCVGWNGAGGWVLSTLHTVCKESVFVCAKKEIIAKITNVKCVVPMWCVMVQNMDLWEQVPGAA